MEAEFSIPLFYKLLPAVGSMLGAAAALLLYHQLPDFTVSFRSVSQLIPAELVSVGKLSSSFPQMIPAELVSIGGKGTQTKLGFPIPSSAGNGNYRPVIGDDLGYMMYSFFNGKY